ncbi:MAG: hypothetical protein ACOVS5_09765 [Oligoflexus sp.]|jgi:hypothetical protein
MFATLLMLFVLGMLLIPGVVLAHQPMALSFRLFFRIFVLQALLFMGIGLMCKLFPWLIDPRVTLW